VPAVTGRALDFGAGFGACHEMLAQYCGEVDAFEMDSEALAGCRARGYAVATAQWEELRGPYALVGAFDVIEHLENDVAWLKKIHARMQEGGTIALSVPAFMFLWSEHDVLHQHYRRYTKKTITKALQDAGFEVIRTSYWNFLLFPVALLMRLIGKAGGESLSPSKPVNAALDGILTLEATLIPTWSLPWGTSVAVIARKVTPDTPRNDFQ
jgi:SAM-dependent methyltransferase